VLYECALLLLMVARVYFWVKWGISKFLSFSINVDVMRVYVVGAVGLVPFCFGCLFEEIEIFCEDVVAPYAFIVVICIDAYHRTSKSGGFLEYNFIKNNSVPCCWLHISRNTYYCALKQY
jgi:hypothetical protein